MESSSAFEEIARPSTSDSKKVIYDVFINHGSTGSKHSLASSICDDLHLTGVHFFLDKGILEMGHVNIPGDVNIPFEIEEAIRTSLHHIAILSPNYAHSPWCLAELSFMLKNGKRVVPVLCGVELSDVRDVKGVFADAFAEYEMKNMYTPQKLDEWKGALQSVSRHSHEILKSNENVWRAYKRIKNRLREQEELGIHPVGLEEMVGDFQAAMESKDSNKNFQIVGIVGSGGSGKTTLAKELYRRKCQMMKRSSFLSNVRSNAAGNALVNLQKQLVGDLQPDRIDKDIKIDSIDDGKIILASRFRSVRLLLVLDDIDHVNQLDALLHGKETLGRGSLIIVTTRHIDVLRSRGITSIYRMNGLDRPHAEELLCRHAFLRPSPPDVLTSSVEMLVRHCDGLPLVLKVFGRQLSGKSISFWKSLSRKASRTLPNAIKERLQIIFDALDGDEQEIFLDIACFFTGEEKKLAITVWDGLGWNGMHTLETLLKKCLVELDEKKRIRMHDELRDFGRELATRRSSYRLWSPEQIGEIKKQHKMAIRGITAATSQFVVCSAHEEFPTCSGSYQPPFKDCMELIDKSSRSSEDGDDSDLPCPLSEDESVFYSSNISLKLLSTFPDEDESELHSSSRSTTSLSPLKPPRLLKLPTAPSTGLYFLLVKGPDLTEEYGALSKGIIWLRWFDCDQTSLPPWLLFETLRVLELYNAISLKELWPSNATPPLMLRELVISCSWGSSFERFPPSISKLTCLTKIALKGYLGDEFQIQELPEEFGLLPSLEHLELRHCKALSSLPTSFGLLKGLLHLDLSSCKALSTLPLTFKHLTKLQYLDLSGCSKLDFRLDILEGMSELEKLYLSGCHNLEELPDIKNQACLRQLHLEDTNLMYIPINIDQLSELQVLTIGSPLLTSLPDSLGDLYNLNSLSIIDCIDLESLPASLKHLNLLEYLYIKSSGVSSLAIWQFQNLKTLKICNCPIDHLDFGQEYSMKQLKLINVSQTPVTKISISEHCCPVLEIIQLEQNDNLVNIEILPTTVKNIELSDCELLSDISCFNDLVNLQVFERSGCPELDKL